MSADSAALLDVFWQGRVSELEQEHGAGAMARLRTLRRGSGSGDVPGQQPTLAYLPGLAARPWWSAADTGLSRVVEALEDRWEALREEALADPVHGARLEAYPHFSLEGGGVYGWDVRFVVRSGVLQWGALPQLPVLAETLEAFPRLGRVECFDSRLAHGAHIVAHTGTTNLALTVQLPLEVPSGDGALRVGSRTQPWVPGQALVFDDTFEHEAWNRGATARTVLLLTLSHPDLTDVECAVRTALGPELSALDEALLQARCVA